jgi:hypothetical protein
MGLSQIPDTLELRTITYPVVPMREGPQHFPIRSNAGALLTASVGGLVVLQIERKGRNRLARASAVLQGPPVRLSANHVVSYDVMTLPRCMCRYTDAQSIPAVERPRWHPSPRPKGAWFPAKMNPAAWPWRFPRAGAPAVSPACRRSTYRLTSSIASARPDVFHSGIRR